MNAKVEPISEAPGAGLPGVELFFARLLFGWIRMTSRPAEATARFRKERAAIAALVSGFPEEKAGRRVLIKRLRGLEDSSRNWSVWMTLDHLRITNLAFGRVLRSLGQGKSPERVVSTADVKPSPEVESAIVGEFERSCEFFLDTVAATEGRETAVRYAHPWFGALDAHGWRVLAAFHMGLHRRQILKIQEALA